MDNKLLDGFPPLAAAFAYGSGVFDQPGLYSNGSDKPVLDMIFCVEDARKWHSQNLEEHPHHYSSFGRLGGTSIVSLSKALDAPVYFNTLIPWQDRLIKYGVTSTTALQQDLCHWTHLYLAGRLHKPVRWLQHSEDLQAAVQHNQMAALAAALLLLPNSFSAQTLLAQIVGLSYMGDMRMGIAEDTRKVHRIVEGSYDMLWASYQPLLGRLDDCVMITGTDMKTERGAALVQRLTGHLPQGFAAAMQQHSHAEVSTVLRHMMQSTVKRSSQRQAILGICSAGITKTVQYTWRKIAKAWR